MTAKPSCGRDGFFFAIILHFSLKEKQREQLKQKFYREAIVKYHVEYHKILFHFYNVSIAFGEQAERISYQSEECIKEHKLHQYLLELHDLIKGGKEIVIYFDSIYPDQQSKALDELVEANKYFKNGDYGKAVAHCRAALDPIIKEELQKIKGLFKI